MGTKVSDLIAKWIAERGIRHVFAVSGGADLHLLDSLARRADVKIVCTQSEQGAGFAADAYARVRGFGCYITTSGPGATNAFTPLKTAHGDSVPLMLITGNQTRARLDDYGTRGYGFQAISDIADTYRPHTKYAVTVTDEKTILETLWRAWLIATEGRPGPVLVDIPDDVQRCDL